MLFFLDVKSKKKKRKKDEEEERSTSIQRKPMNNKNVGNC